MPAEAFRRFFPLPQADAQRSGDLTRSPSGPQADDAGVQLVVPDTAEGKLRELVGAAAMECVCAVCVLHPPR